MTTLFTILFDGVAYGMLLFILACGLAVTLGLMNFVNLAHGVFAMGGGYVTALMMNRAGVIDYAARALDAEKDEFMNQTLLIDLPVDQRLVATRRIMHKDLHRN